MFIPARIDPGTGFRIVVKCPKYTANLDYGPLEMADQVHELWVDANSGYNLDKFFDDMACFMIWGSSQTLAVWAVDVDSAACWKISKNEHFEKMIQSRRNERIAQLTVEVVQKEGYQTRISSAGSKLSSGLTSEADQVLNPEGHGDSCRSPEQPVQVEVPIIDWETLTILPQPELDGEARAVVDEDEIFEAMGFKDTDENAEKERASGEPVIHGIPAEIQQDMRDAEINVDDKAPEEPNNDWDRDDPDLSVGTVYPCMKDFRLAVKQHAIVKEFELGTEKSDKSRFRGFCKARGCPWVIRAKTQNDNSVRVLI